MRTLARINSNPYAGLQEGTRSKLLELKQSEGVVTFSVRVQPRASKDEIAGIMDGVLKVRLQAPALEDRANEALCEYLAQLLKTPKSAVRILSGERSRIKRIEIRGVTEQQVLALLMHDA
jgi:uncharacterized protein (TIGR00251 family)